VNEIVIRNKRIGLKQPVFITAEVGVTCNYDMDISKRLIDVVSASGADAIKFIFWFPEEIMSDKTIPYSYQTLEGEKTENMFEMLQGLRFTLDQWKELKAYADEKNVILFSTVNSPSGIEWAEAIGIDAYKLSSWDFNYHSLWRKIARIGKPMIIDTGPVHAAELAQVLNILKQEKNDRVLLVHCVHTDKALETNMLSIPYLRTAFRVLSGYSSRNRDSETDIVSVALGAVYLEKRLTLDRHLPGHHHVISLEPAEFESYVRMIRSTREALGELALTPSHADLEERRKWFRHIVANRDLSAGTVLEEGMLESKRPEKGVSPEYLEFFIGRALKRDLKYNEALSWDDV
jgi:sialic acid synthase SpsE